MHSGERLVELPPGTAEVGRELAQPLGVTALRGRTPILTKVGGRHGTHGEFHVVAKLAKQHPLLAQHREVVIDQRVIEDTPALPIHGSSSLRCPECSTRRAR